MAYSFNDFQQRVDKALAHVRQDIGTLRTGKAAVEMLDPVSIEAYGTQMKINEVANVSAPSPDMLVVQPWDSSILENIVKGISSASLNLNPVIDGEIIRIKVPPLTEERRQEMVKLLQKKIEAGRVMLRSVRTDIKQEIEDLESTDNVSEDDIHRDIQQLDKLTQAQMQQLDELATAKEKELLTV